MIYTTCIMAFATFGYQKSTTAQVGLTASLLSLAAFITLYYHYLQDPTFHQVAYALLTALVLFRAMYIMEVNIRPKFRHKKTVSNGHVNGHANGHTNGSVTTRAQKDEQELRDKTDLQTLRTMWTMIAYGLTIFLGGFALWNLDNIYCSRLKKWRHELGLPWGVLLEGHGWWHLMTGVGAYYYIAWGIWLRHHLNGTQDQVRLIWPRMFTSVPEVVRIGGKGKKVQ
jgi:dihydroceramidase